MLKVSRIVHRSSIYDLRGYEEWSGAGLQQKILSYTSMLAMARLLEYITLECADPRAKDLFYEVFGCMEDFDESFGKMLNKMQIKEAVMAKSRKTSPNPLMLCYKRRRRHTSRLNELSRLLRTWSPTELQMI